MKKTGAWSEHRIHRTAAMKTAQPGGLSLSYCLKPAHLATA